MDPRSVENARRSLLHNLAMYAKLEKQLPSTSDIDNLDSVKLIELTDDFIAITDGLSRDVRNIRELSGRVNL